MDHHLVENAPCIITKMTTEWAIREQWIDHESHTINYQHLSAEYGDEEVDVASCGQKSYSDQQRSKMKLKEYLQYLQQRPLGGTESDDDTKGDTEISAFTHSDDAMNQWLSDVDAYKLSAFDPSWTDSILYCKDWHIAQIGDFYTTPLLFSDD